MDYETTARVTLTLGQWLKVETALFRQIDKVEPYSQEWRELMNAHYQVNKAIVRHDKD